MFSPKRTALYLAIGAISLAAADATAGCKTLASGAQFCASYIPGSVICQGVLSGINPNDGAEGFCDVSNPLVGTPTGTVFCAKPPKKVGQTPDCHRHYSNDSDDDDDANTGPHQQGDCWVIPNQLVPTPDDTVPQSTDFVQPVKKKTFRFSLEVDVPPNPALDAICLASNPAFPNFVSYTPNAFLGTMSVDHTFGSSFESCSITEQCVLNGNIYTCTPFASSGC